MTKRLVAKELLKMAKELLAIDFPNKDALDKYLKDHPDADRSNHKVVETKKEESKKEEPKKDMTKKDSGKTLKDFDGQSTKYHLESVLPALKKTLSKHVPSGVKLRGSGRKTRQHLELIADFETGKRPGDTLPVQIDIHGSFMTHNDGEYEVRVHSPYFNGDHTWHEKFSGEPEKDADTISETMGDLLEDFKDFLKKDGKIK
jgi:hypothetical protein